MFLVLFTAVGATNSCSHEAAATDRQSQTHQQVLQVHQQVQDSESHQYPYSATTLPN